MIKQLKMISSLAILLISVCFLVSCSQPSNGNTDNNNSGTNSDATTVSNVANELDFAEQDVTLYKAKKK
jgi:hypothetical protein